MTTGSTREEEIEVSKSMIFQIRAMMVAKNILTTRQVFPVVPPEHFVPAGKEATSFSEPVDAGA
jgi:hypothetical protein